MNFLRQSIWAMVFTLLSPALLADNLQEARAYCQSQLASGEPPCHLQPCPCTPGDTTLERFSQTHETPALCACRSSQAARLRARQQAAEICNDYRHRQHQSCFISRGDCPPGFEPIADFSDDAGNSFSACRDIRNTRRKTHAANLRGLTTDALLAQYDQLIATLESQRIDHPKPLPQPTIEALVRHFPNVPLKRLTLTTTRALSQGCFTDCTQIFCADDKQIAEWTDNDNPRITRNLLHQILHAERCVREGGRERFVANWFEHLPDDVYQQLQDGKPINAERIHFAMYMESHAINRADSLCRHLYGCRPN
jgi:hypothetical protein